MTGGLPPISSSWRHAPWDSRPDFFQLNICFHIPYVTSSLTRRCACSLQLLLVLASTIILRSDSRRTRDHILLSQIRDYRNPEDKVPVFKSTGTGWPSYTLQALFLFSPPPTTRRATVEVFNLACTRECLVLSPGRHYVASARTAQTTQLPRALLLLQACLLRLSREGYWDIA
jgi:hypothetical protein